MGMVLFMGDFFWGKVLKRKLNRKFVMNIVNVINGNLMSFWNRIYYIMNCMFLGYLLFKLNGSLCFREMIKVCNDFVFILLIII